MNEHEARVQQAHRVLTRRVQNVVPGVDHVALRLAEEKKHSFYLGIDPTGPDIHIGHTVPLLLLEELSLLGHEIILLVGDFTARIGDPTGKDTARRVLTTEEIQEHVLRYEAQLRTILPATPFRVVYNSEWLDPMTLSNVLSLTSRVTVQQMIVRDMFQERLKQEKPIFVSEFLYPLLQGYDSVALRIDGEVGGNDQFFNMMVGRDLCREMLGTDKMVLATHLVVDPVSGKKMSKSEGTLIAITDSPAEIRRKVLALHDTSIKNIFTLCTRVPLDELENITARTPRDQKELLAQCLIRMYHGEVVDEQSQREQLIDGSGTIVDIIKQTGVVSSSGEAKRLIDQGGVSINDTKVTSWDAVVASGDVVRVGRGRVYRVR